MVVVTNYTATLAPSAYQILAGTLKADGFVTSTFEAQSFLSTYPDSGFIMTDPFTITGLPEPRAFALARNVSLDLVNDLAVALSTLRETGVIADLLNEFVPQSISAGGDLSLGVSPAAELKLRITTIAILSILLGMVGALWLRHRINRQAERERESREVRGYGGESVAMDTKLGPTCYMITTFQATKRGYTPTACSVVSATNPPLTCSEIPTSQQDTMRYLLKLCQRGE